MPKENQTDKTETQSSGKNSPLGKLVIYILIGSLAYGLLYFVAFNKKSAPAKNSETATSVDTTTPEVEENPENETVVTLTDKGFDPKTLDIKVGVKVTWLNRSGKTATVNSSPHPAHTDNPVMNLGEFSEGDSMSLVFDKPGTYKYHNHLNPSESGTVTVTE